MSEWNRIRTRVEFMDEIELQIKEEQPFACMIFTLHRMKQLNSWYGEESVNEILENLQEGLQLHFDEGIIARLHGDEFGILLHLDPLYVELKVVAALHDLEYKQYQQIQRIQASFGISFYPQDGTTRKQILENTVLAANLAKEKNLSNFEYYKNEESLEKHRNFKIEKHMYDMVFMEEVYFMYQPIIHLESTTIKSYEALIRWDSAFLGSVSPADFIPIAEENGFIEVLGAYTVERVMKEFTALNNKNHSNLRCSINLSVKQLESKDLLTQVKKLIHEGCNPHYFTFEIVESLSIENCSIAKEVLDELHALGFHLSIDDYGSGYTSLSYLIYYELHYLKLDRSIINEIGNHKVNAIINGVLSACHAMNVEVVAEGVENEEQLNYLKEIGCDYIQGYYFSKPLPYEDL